MNPGATLLALLALAACSDKRAHSAAPTPTSPEDTATESEPPVETETGCALLHRFVDADGDGFGGEAVEVCEDADGLVQIDGDCDDGDPAAHPGAVESCDGVDQDCDGSLDDEPIIAWSDGDADGYGSAPASCPPPPDAAPLAGDCDDTNPAIHPGVTDVCNGVDDDCDGVWDEGPGAPASVLDGVSSDCDDHGELATINDAFGARILGRMVPQEDEMGSGLNVADINGDGFPDLLLGSQYADFPFESTTGKNGVIYVFLGPIGPGDRSAETADLLVYGGQGARVDEAVPTGDVTGDGVDDYLVGGHEGNAEGAFLHSGTAYLVPGPITGDVDLATGYHQYGDPPLGSYMDPSQVQPGDLDGDGLAEVMLGCLNGHPSDYGAAVYLMYGPGTMSLDDATTTYVIDPSEFAGLSGTALGDVTGDGLTDVALQRNGTRPYYGDFFVLVSERHSGQVDWRDAGALYGWFDAPEFDPWLWPGYTIRNLGDVTGDGYDDVGLPSINYGYMHVMAGPLPDDRPFDVFAESPAVLQDPISALGGIWTVESRGDVDGDGTSDLVLGSAGYTVPGLEADCDWEDTCDYGALYVINGPFDGYVDLSVEADLIQGVHHYGMLGWELAAGMDLNADGATDIVATSPIIYSSPEDEEGGVAYVLFGTP
jgi:hypothetical protein